MYLYALYPRMEIIFYVFIKLSIHLREAIKAHYGKSPSGQENKIFDLGGHLTFQLGQLDLLVRDQPQEDGFTMLKREEE